MITYTVTTLTDENDAGATAAVPGGSGLSLREAIALANASAGLDTIVFAAALTGGTIRLTNPAGTLVVNDALQIVGDAGDNGTPDITISGDKGANDVTFAGGITNVFASNLADNIQLLRASAAMAIDGLILTGGVTAASGSAPTVSGGALRSSAAVNVTDSIISGNQALVGGGIAAQSILLNNSTASFNNALLDGGGLYTVSLTLLNATISGNHASNYGGGAFVMSATVVNSTITGNDGAFQGGGIYGHTIDITNSIAIGNTSQSNPNSLQAFILSRHGGNIIGSNNLGGVDHINVYSGEADVGDTAAAEVFAALSVSPISGVLSGTLADNGGGKPTIALRASGFNPAIDASDSSAPALDQIGAARVDQSLTNVNGAAADLGAKELGLLPPVTGTSGNDDFPTYPNGARIDAGGGVDSITFNFKLTEATVDYVGNTVVIRGPSDNNVVLTGFEVFKFTDGTVNNNDGDVLVDDLYYYSHNHDVWNAHADADAHFHSVGWREGRDPDAFFSTKFYLAVYPDVKAAGADPLTHFDQTGWKTGRLPSLAFDPAAYLAVNPDVKAAGVDPLAHFLQFGAGEGRQSIAPTELIAPNGFDYVYYLKNNADVAAAGSDPLQHFQQFGWKEGRNPNALFDVNGYLNTYTDVKAAGINPLDHYNSFGWKEGRDPSVNFDTSMYLTTYTDVKAAGVSPLNHFLDFGIHEGRSPFADGVWG
jgi:hypothetical protein